MRIAVPFPDESFIARRFPTLRGVIPSWFAELSTIY
jgi:hypothetical protein